MTKRNIFIGAGILLLVQFGALYWFNQPLICECGNIKFWHGIVLDSENSQHLTDWYTFSHIIHGILFYALLWLVTPRLSHGKRFLIALGIEVAWEINENTPWLIEHYRQQALAQGYTGDSIINSISDTIAMIFGYIVARKSPVYFSIALILALEIGVGLTIRDNLTLNILNFLYPMDAITQWQLGLTQ